MKRIISKLDKSVLILDKKELSNHFGDNIEN